MAVQVRHYFNALLVLSIFFFHTALCAAEKTKKQIVEKAFLAWEKGEGSPFSLLAENATWTIMGPTQTAKTYTIEELTKEVIEPFIAKLKGSLTPTLIDIYQDGDVVIILFEAIGTIINNEIYRNSYAWFFTMEGEKVSKVRAVLDLNAFEYLMATEG